MKNLTKILIPLVIILAALTVAEALYYSTHGRIPGALSSKEATERAMNYINNNLLKGQVTALLVGTSKESGVYKIQLKVENEEYTSYVTEDGKLLFLEGAEISTETPEPTSSEGTNIPKKDTPQAQLFVMSFCPYGNQAEELMKDVGGLLKDKANIQLHYVIYSNYGGGGPNYCLDKESKYCSMHGIQELNQDIRELCVQKYQKDKFWSFIEEINAKCSATNVDSCWEGVAQTVGIDIPKIKKCQKEEGLTMVEQELQLDKKYGISGSPQLIINDVEYQGARTAEAYKAAVCSGFNTVPSECSQTLQSENAPASGECQ